jgi:LmbE family N-acetylglucosaminyl deacetylase
VTGLAPHRVAELLLIMDDHYDHFVDIGPTFQRKLEAVRAHASQWGTHPDLEAFLRARAQRLGESEGIALAESFKRLLPT